MIRVDRILFMRIRVNRILIYGLPSYLDPSPDRSSRARVDIKDVKYSQILFMGFFY